jgi:hypothetical protein
LKQHDSVVLLYSKINELGLNALAKFVRGHSVSLEVNTLKMFHKVKHRYADWISKPICKVIRRWLNKIIEVHSISISRYITDDTF